MACFCMGVGWKKPARDGGVNIGCKGKLIEIQQQNTPWLQVSQVALSLLSFHPLCACQIAKNIPAAMTPAARRD